MNEKDPERDRAIQVYTPEGDAPLSLYATVLSSFFRHHWRLTTSRNLGFPSKLLFRWPSSNFFEKILKVRDFVPQVGFFRLLAPRTGALTHRFAVVCRPIELEVKNRYVCSSEIAGFPCNASRDADLSQIATTARRNSGIARPRDGRRCARRRCSGVPTTHPHVVGRASRPRASAVPPPRWRRCWVQHVLRASSAPCRAARAASAHGHRACARPCGQWRSARVHLRRCPSRLTQECAGA